MRKKKGHDRRESIIRYMDSFHRIHHRSPGVREISAGTGISLASVSRALKEMIGLGMLIRDGTKIVTKKIARSHPECCYAGMLGSVSSRPRRMEEEEAECFYPLPEDLFGPGPLFLLRASDDSMVGAGICDGDLVVIRKTEDTQENDVVVAWVEGKGCMLKRLKRGADDRLMLHPENPAYPDIPAENARIQGVAVKVIRKLPENRNA